MEVDTELVGSDQQTIDTPRVCSLCRCGESSYKPLCDGSHAKVGFDGKSEDSDKKVVEYYYGKEIGDLLFAGATPNFRDLPFFAFS